MLKTVTLMRFVSGAFALALGLGAETAHAGTVSYSGAECNPVADSVNAVSYSQFGVHAFAIAFSGPTVVCPVPIPFSSTTTGNLQNVVLNVFDRNNTTNPEAVNFNCTLYVVSGSGVFANPPKQPNLFNPGAAPLPIFLNNSVSGATSANVVCTMPNQTNAGVSHILSYTVTTN